MMNRILEEILVWGFYMPLLITAYVVCALVNLTRPEHKRHEP